MILIDVLNNFAQVLVEKRIAGSLFHGFPLRFEFEVCESKEESTFAECLFGEVPPSPHYSEGSSYSVLLLLSDDSPLQEYLAELCLIIWLSVRELEIPLDYRRVKVCLVQLAAGLSLPLHLSSPLQSTLRWKQGSLSHHVPHSCITIEHFFAFCGGSGLQEEWWSTQTLIQIS